MNKIAAAEMLEVMAASGQQLAGVLPGTAADQAETVHYCLSQECSQ